MKVYLIGAGMGNPELLTAEAEKAIRSSDLLLGAERLLAMFQGELQIPMRALVRPPEIAAAVRQCGGEQVSVLLSGDLGFFSGARLLYPLLEGLEVVSLPGISSLSYFCAKCQLPWQDVHVLSCHGRDGGILPAVQSHMQSFALTGGAYRVENLCRQLEEAGYGELNAWAGERLSYPEERIVRGTVAELAEQSFDDLAVLLVENPAPVQPIFQAPGLPDEAFRRGKVPMTKEEVRVLAVSRLRLCSRDIVWDVGAGTGSVSVECALALPEGRVYAVERRPEACALLRENRTAFQLSNLVLVEGEAPAALETLPPPDAVFIGGSGGHLREIITAALDRNTAVRIVLTAITLETLGEALEIVRFYGFRETDLVQIAVSRSHEVGGYHMMRAENPIYLLSMEKPS